MSFGRIFYLIGMLAVGLYLYSSSSSGSESSQPCLSRSQSFLEDIQLRVWGTLQLPIFAAIGLYFSLTFGSGGAITCTPVLPPSYPLAVRSPYLSGAHPQSAFAQIKLD